MTKSFLLFCLFIIINTLIYGQYEDNVPTVGHLQGRVSDGSVGDVIPYATIRLEIDGALVQNTVTNADGDYSLREIEAGSYDLVALSMGYPPLKIKDLQIDVDAILELNLVFPGETFDQDTVTYTFEEVKKNKLYQHKTIKKKSCQEKRKDRIRKRQEQAAKRLN